MAAAAIACGVNLILKENPPPSPPPSPPDDGNTKTGRIFGQNLDAATRYKDPAFDFKIQMERTIEVIVTTIQLTEENPDLDDVSRNTLGTLVFVHGKKLCDTFIHRLHEVANRKKIQRSGGYVNDYLKCESFNAATVGVKQIIKVSRACDPRMYFVSELVIVFFYYHYLFCIRCVLLPTLPVLRLLFRVSAFLTVWGLQRWRDSYMISEFQHSKLVLSPRSKLYNGWVERVGDLTATEYKCTMISSGRCFLYFLSFFTFYIFAVRL